MLETLENDRIFLYEWIDGKWKMIRRMVKYPAAIENFSLGQTLMTPNFHFYLDFDVDL